MSMLMMVMLLSMTILMLVMLLLLLLLRGLVRPDVHTAKTLMIKGQLLECSRSMHDDTFHDIGGWNKRCKQAYLVTSSMRPWT